MSKQTNIEAQNQFGAAVNSGNLQEFYALVAESAVDHDPAPNQDPGPNGYIVFFTMMRTAFPDFKLTVEHLVADEENVAFAYTATGTHQGEFMGVAPTGKSIKIRGMQISKFEGGKLVERWGSTDELGLLKQIGVALTSA